MEKLEKCSICPRKCGVNRNVSTGFCNEKHLRVAKIIEHFSWEEPCLSNEKGVLAIFFSGCNLKCYYCQNHEISRGGVGKIYSVQELAALLNEKQQSHSAIDLVTPTHFAAELEEVFSLFNCTVPVIWNTNSYECPQTIKRVCKFVDIFLADLKYSNNALGQKFSACKDYFSYALPAIEEMCQEKADKFQDGVMQSGVIIRHLVLPGHIKNSLEVLDIIKQHFPQRMISIMSQFTPNGKSSLNRKITPIEYKLVLSHMQKLGLENGFVQSLDSANCTFVPKF